HRPAPPEARRPSPSKAAGFINAGKPTGADLPGCRRERDFCRRRQAPQNLPKRRDRCAETQEPPSRSRKAGRKWASPQADLPRRVSVDWVVADAAQRKPVSASLSPVIPCYLKFFRGKDSPPFAAAGCMPQVSRCILPMIFDARGLANQRKC